ncbi:hypothetical protein [Mycoplasma suis]|uniref:Uncharacterized protein n=1 Tax=Mycoplasma suis (strain Illinois) TaxID=768700 RepID=F0QRQ4_MYCSL|nr:hypothetical protein [Mycoplasma suis]ADX98174.1 hypothetical protein MSU_0643 [Mycoplasma suis str. Illinois]
MFTFSKVITLGVILAGTSGLSAYLIPYSLAQNSIFSTDNISLKDGSSEKFIKEEEEKLEILKPLLEKLSKAIKDSESIKDIKNQGIEEALKTISQTESKLSEVFENHSGVIKNLSRISSLISDQRNRKMKVLAELENISSGIKLLKKFNEFFENWEKLFSSILEAIDSGDKNNELRAQNSDSNGGETRNRGKKS